MPYESSGSPPVSNLLSSTPPSTVTWSSVPAYVKIRVHGLKASRVKMNSESLWQLGKIMTGNVSILSPFKLHPIPSMRK